VQGPESLRNKPTLCTVPEKRTPRRPTAVLQSSLYSAWITPFSGTALSRLLNHPIPERSSPAEGRQVKVPRHAANSPDVIGQTTELIDFLHLSCP